MVIRTIPMRGPHASISYEYTIMYSAPYRAASDQTPYCSTSTNFPWNGKTNGLKRQISNFSAKENEKFYECWERYMEAINACPHHGFDTWLLNPEEAMDFLSYVAEVSRGWDEPNKRRTMTRRLEELELKKMHEVQAVAETPVQVKPCSICQSYEHLVEECPTIPVAREMFGDQANVIGQFKPNTMLRMEILTTQVGGIIQIFHGSQEHLSTNSRLNHLNKLQVLNKQ
ncbi:hypothetical protein CK203_048382 [Vitis vinifera]|uniref:Retrotransposon gag domain-containing protein n=1 Tax=Vitis vinifera TaxID=29760 RepID=A0A438HRJ5_VITVI|nr:hypothetical protein CK203_048382 [Vitis vinifera]